jgi:flagellin-like hook-associated protein FlgL
LIGQDVNPVRVNGPFTALQELKAGLHADDAQAITFAGERLQETLERMQEVQGRLASKAKVMLERAARVEGETTATHVLRSDVRDVDMAEAIVRFQQMQTALQANLSTASRIFGLSLLDYLR